jgi:steroid delta-isomerase
MALLLMIALSALVGSAPAVEGSARHARKYENLARSYFSVWNTHDAEALHSLLADNASLRDWDIDVSGASEVVKANGNIFAKVPHIFIDVITIHVSEHTRTAVCEILVRLHKTQKDAGVLRVVDVIEFDDVGKIVAVRAYKG